MLNPVSGAIEWLTRKCSLIERVRGVVLYQWFEQTYCGYWMRQSEEAFAYGPIL